MNSKFRITLVLAVLASFSTPLCGGTYSAPRRISTITDGRIVEASGITPSLLRPEIVWINNDSGDSPRIFAIRLSDGAVIAEVAVSGATAVDWECIGSGPGPDPGRPFLYIGDVGNNGLNRSNLRVYRIPEPALPSLTPGQKLTSAPAAKLRFTYPDGNFDCEGLLVHPRTASLYLFTKKTAPSGVYRLTASVDDGLSHVAERVGTISVPNVITDAAFSADGLRLGLRTYAAIHEMTVSSPDAPISAFLGQTPASIQPPPEPQGEALCYAIDVSGIFTVSEGNPVPIHFLESIPSGTQPYCQVAGGGDANLEAGPAEAPAAAVFLRGDSNDDREVNISDALHILAALFGAGAVLTCEDASDANDDGRVDLSDPLELLRWLFLTVDRDSLIGEANEDFTPDEIDCAAHAPLPEPGGPGQAGVAGSGEATLIRLGDLWRYRGSPQAPPSTWKDPSFDDSSWSRGPTGIGYGDGDDATVIAMQGSFMTLYARAAFQVSDPAAFDALRIEIDYDDGFVAYLNGVEVARRGLGQPGTVTTAGQPAASHEAGVAESIPICLELLAAGRNVLAFEVHNTDLSSSDLSFRPALFGHMRSTLIQVGDPWRYRGNPQAPPSTWKDLSFDDTSWSQGPTGIGYGDGDDATVIAMQGSFMTLYARRAFPVADPSRFEGLTLTIDYDDGFVAYLNGVEVARRGLGQPGTPTSPDQAAVSHEAGIPESISISPASLLAGKNVLAFEVHNTSLSSSDLSFRPAVSAQFKP